MLRIRSTRCSEVRFRTSKVANFQGHPLGSDLNGRVGLIWMMTQVLGGIMSASASVVDPGADFVGHMEQIEKERMEEERYSAMLQRHEVRTFSMKQRFGFSQSRIPHGSIFMSDSLGMASKYLGWMDGSANPSDSACGIRPR
jgi:hypothetical protein